MNQKHINIAIKKIKEVEFIVNEEIGLTDPSLANIGFELTTNINPEAKTVELLLTAFFFHQLTGNVFLKIRTSNLFLLLELADFSGKGNDEFDIPDNILVTLLSLSISHTRALLARNAIGTKFSELYIPIVDPSEVLKQMYGKH